MPRRISTGDPSAFPQGDRLKKIIKKGHSFADPSHKLRASAQGFGSGQRLPLLFCHSDPERSEGEESPPFSIGNFKLSSLIIRKRSFLLTFEMRQLTGHLAIVKQFAV